MNQHFSHPLRPMPRGIFSGLRAEGEPNPGAVLRDLSTTFAEFRSRQDVELSELRASVDDLSRGLVSARLNGFGDPGAPAASREAMAAFSTFARSGDARPMSALAPHAGMSTESGPDGGYLVPDQVSTEILRLQLNVSPMRQLARVVPTKTKDYTQPFSVGGTSSGWVAERDARPETGGSKLAMLEFPAGEIYAIPAVTQTLIDDADFDVGTFVVEEISREFDQKEGAAFITGDGLKKPRGFLTYKTFVGAENAKFGQLQAVHSGDATHIPTFDCLVNVLQALKAAHRANSTWLMNSNTQGVIQQIKDGQGNYIWQRATALGAPDTLLGRPVAIDEGMPDIAAGTFPVAIGNWKLGYLINDRLGVRVLRDPYSNKPFVMFYATKRVGGGILDSEAIKLLQISA